MCFKKKDTKKPAYNPAGFKGVCLKEMLSSAEITTPMKTKTVLIMCRTMVFDPRIIWSTWSITKNDTRADQLYVADTDLSMQR